MMGMAALMLFQARPVVQSPLNHCRHSLEVTTPLHPYASMGFGDSKSPHVWKESLHVITHCCHFIGTDCVFGDPDLEREGQAVPLAAAPEEYVVNDYCEDTR